MLNVHVNIVQHDYNMNNFVDNYLDMKHHMYQLQLLEKKNKNKFKFLLINTYDYKQNHHQLN